MRELLRAGREELPSERLGDRTMRVLGLAAGATAILTVATPASSAAVGAAVVAKWASMGVLVGVVTAGSLVGVERLVVRPVALAPSATAAVTPPGSALPKAVTMAQAADHPPGAESAQPRSALRDAQREAPPASSGLPSVREDSLAREVAALDEARGALRRDDLGAARRALDAYEAEPGRGTLRAEALYLRIETLVRAGEHSAATEVARQLLRDYPGSAPAARARELVGPEIP
jgi:TolA-binding protein